MSEAAAQESLFRPEQITYNSKALEAHYTPDWLARYVVATAPWDDVRALRRRPRVLEPHAGGGAFLRALAPRRQRLKIDSRDVDKNCWAVQQGGARCGDFFEIDPKYYQFDLIIGNPPFSNAEEHLRHALALARLVIFVLPMSRLETPTRQRFYDENGTRQVIQLPERVWPGSRSIGVFLLERGYTGRHDLVLDAAAVDPDQADV